jgi:LacI family transcriptional regulator
MASRPVTIVDVARHAGVSHSTVSRVLNGHPYVRSETRTRVEQAVEALGYVANLQARGLAGGPSGSIGLVALEVSNSYVVEVIRGVDEELAASGLDLMLSTTRRRDVREREQVLRLSQGLCDGVIVLIPAAPDLYLEELAARNYPIVLIDHAATPFASSTTMANRSSTEQAMAHLIELGHRRIGHVTGNLATDAARKRMLNWRAMLQTHQLDHGDDLLAEGNFQRESGQLGAATLLDRPDPPTAILAGSDSMAVGVLDEVRKRGIRCPDDLSVMGFDDVLEATVTTPQLSTIRQPMQALGRQAVRLLTDRLGNPDVPTVHVELATELIVRGSTAAPAR